MSNTYKLNQINFHFLNQCNYRCKYCLVDKKYNNYPNMEQMKHWIDVMSDYFEKNKVINPRINLVGGEPMLYPEITSLIKYIHSKAIRVSIITNGSLLTESILDEIGNYLYMVGVSVDTLSEEIACSIGRVDNKGKVLKTDNLVNICNQIKSKGIILKINTVISKLNYEEDFSLFLEKVKADRVKFLELYIIDDINKESSSYKLTQSQYDKFCKKHGNCNNVIRETNEKFDGGYIMLDYKGNLIVNIDHNHFNCGNIEKIKFDQIAEMALKKIKKNNYDIRLK